MFNGNELAIREIASKEHSTRRSSALRRKRSSARANTRKGVLSRGKGVTRRSGSLDGENTPELERIDSFASDFGTPASAPVAPVADAGGSVPTSAGQYSGNSDHNLLDVGSVPLLSREEEVELAARIQAGDEAARERMIRANLRLVIKIARDYEHLGLPLADIVSEGTIGLMKAVDRFNPSKGAKLSTYGSWWIKQQIRRALANQGRTIRLPVHVEGKLYQLGRAEARLRHELGREATTEELAAELDSDPHRIERLRDAAVRPASLDASLGEDSNTNVAEVVADERAETPFQQLRTKFDHELIRKLVQKLPKREEKILRLRFGLDGGEEQTLEEVGEKFGLTRERIRQIQNEAFKKLRVLMDNPEALPAAA